MKQAELQQYRAMLQAQMAEPPPRRGLFGSGVTAVAALGGDFADVAPPAGPLRRTPGPLFGRRQAPLAAPERLEPLLLDTPLPVAAAPARRPHAPAAAAHFSETPYHAEDLADPPATLSVTPGVIAGWSAAKPPGAETRLLRRLSAVLQAEHQGLRARLGAAEVMAA